jgi:hypothetical protein
MVIAAGIWKRPAANRAQGMSDELDVGPAGGTKVLSVPSGNPAAASPAARRVEPVHQPIETIHERM